MMNIAKLKSKTGNNSSEEEDFVPSSVFQLF